MGPRSASPLRAPAVAIVSHNSLSDLETFLAGQLEAAAALDAPVIVVDNGSADGSREFLQSLRPPTAGLELISNSQNRGYAAAVNQAFAAAPGRDVFVLNPDVALSDDGSLARLGRWMETRPQAGAVGPRLLNQDGSVQASARRFPSPLAMAGHASIAGRSRLARRASSRYLALPAEAAACRVDWVLGAAMLVRREAYDEVGGWDERYFLYLEDTDFCLRLAGKGWESWWVPEVSLHHAHARRSDPAHGSIVSSAERRAHVASMIRFFSRHRNLILGRHLSEAG